MVLSQKCKLLEKGRCETTKKMTNDRYTFMLERILEFAIEHRFLIVLGIAALAGVGVYSLQRLPIDAVPDITPNQVQINTVFAGLSPVEIEKQVTFPIETALAGTPGLTNTRSRRNGFSQVVAVFKDDVDIYFARQQVNERLIEARKSLPPGADPKMGAITTGLGEVYVWTVDYEHLRGKGAQSKDGSSWMAAWRAVPDLGRSNG